jgi:uncharacterized protein YeaO (DUF488 family)
LRDPPEAEHPAKRDAFLLIGNPGYSRTKVDLSRQGAHDREEGEVVRVNITVKRVYEYEQNGQETVFLVDRIWPRGISRERLGSCVWKKEAAPSNELRKTFHAGAMSFADFRKAYTSELAHNADALQLYRECRALPADRSIVLLYSSKNQTENNAIVLKEWLEKGNQ